MGREPGDGFGLGSCSWGGEGEPEGGVVGVERAAWARGTARCRVGLGVSSRVAATECWSVSLSGCCFGTC